MFNVCRYENDKAFSPSNNANFDNYRYPASITCKIAKNLLYFSL